MPQIPLKERFLTKVQIDDPNGCWLWTASTFNGYGKIGRGGAGSGWMYAHQAAWLIYRGELPTDGLEIDHICHNRGCANPNHLQAVTHAENMRRQPRAQIPTCPRGHEYGTYRDKRGRRRCRECLREAWRRKYDKVRKKPRKIDPIYTKTAKGQPS